MVDEAPTEWWRVRQQREGLGVGKLGLHTHYLAGDEMADEGGKNHPTDYIYCGIL